MSEFNPDLEAALALKRLGELTFEAHLPEGWQQGRGAFGGLVLGLLVRAMEQAEPDPVRTLRTFSGEILAPVLTGPAQLRAEVLRRGNGISSVAARLHQDGELRAHASAIFARTRLTDREWVRLEPPAIPPWPEVQIAPVEPPIGPAFARAFEFRPTVGLPFSGVTEPETAGFVRLRRPPARFGPAELLAYADAWWPTAFSIEPEPRPIATLTFALQVCMDLGDIPVDAPLYHRGRGHASHGGYVPELRELWTADGRLVALNPQTFAIIR